MDYALAKQLQDAGYQFRRIEPGMCVGPWPVLDMNPSGDREIGAQHFYAPTLAELIEACGGSFRQLQRTELGIWRSWGWQDDLAGYYNTPEEAVARLWLALNKK